MFNSRIIATLIAFFALTTLFMSQKVTGHNENDPPEHTHIYPKKYGVCLSAKPSVTRRVDGDCTTITVCAAFVAVASTACTHGVWQPPPPRHPDPCGCAATNCGYSSCGCWWGEGNGGKSECPCETTCS